MGMRRRSKRRGRSLEASRMTLLRCRPSLRYLLVLFFAASSAIAASPFRWSGESGSLRVTITDRDVVAVDSSGKRVFSLAALSRPDIVSDKPDVETQSTLYPPLSLVGPYLSFESAASAMTPSAAPVLHLHTVVTPSPPEPTP